MLKICQCNSPKLNSPFPETQFYIKEYNIPPLLRRIKFSAYFDTAIPNKHLELRNTGNIPVML